MSDTRSSDESQPDILSDASNANDAVSQASDADQHLRFITHDTITDEGHNRLDQAVMGELGIEGLLAHKIIVPGQHLIHTASRMSVLCSICQTGIQEGLSELTFQEARGLIEEYPELGEMVDRAWVNGAGFKDIRRLGEY